MSNAPQTPPAAAYISFSAAIDVRTVERLLDVAANLANQNIPEVHLLLSTEGGSVMHGINAYNVLKALPFKLVTHNVGNVDSIGNAIFLAGDERFACPHSTFMFHGVGYNGGGMVFDAKLAQERLDGLRADQLRISSIITDRSDLTAQDVDKFFLSAKTLTAQEGLAAGLIGAVQDVVIPVGVPTIALTFPR